MVYAAWLAAVVGVGVVLAAAGAERAAGGLPTLRREHPRLFLTKEVLARLEKGIESDPQMRALAERIRRKADRIMDEAPVEHKLIGPRLLSVSRRCLRRVATLGLVYRLTGERKYAERAWREMDAAAGFRDWNPSHFLDTAEMSAALGIGYDWLYDTLTDDQRARIRRALVEKGLTPGLRCYRGEARYGWWTRSRFNWNQVCNGGLAQGSLAIADEEPKVAGEVIESGLASVRAAMGNFGVDGGWAEGPGYWGYTMMYTSRYLDALRTALGSTFDLEKAQGLAEAGLFRLYAIGPTGLNFNFADAGEDPGGSSAMFWLARTFDRPVCAWHQRQRLGDDPFDLIWYTPEGKSPEESGLPLAKLFRGVDVVMLRSHWGTPDALWVAFKGGDNKANHSNLDLGTFVLDATGERWAHELGRDDYNLPGYFGGKRWTYYRLRTEGQNTLVIDGENQDTKAEAPVVAFHARGSTGSAVADLSKGYPKASSVHRGVRMIDGRRVVIQDELMAREPVEVVWGMHTEAKVMLDGPKAVLEQGGKRLGMRVLEPEGAVFAVVDVKPEPPQRPLPGMRKVTVTIPNVTRSVRIAVEFIPTGAEEGGPSPVEPLEAWPGWRR